MTAVADKISGKDTVSSLSPGQTQTEKKNRKISLMDNKERDEPRAPTAGAGDT